MKPSDLHVRKDKTNFSTVEKYSFHNHNKTRNNNLKIMTKNNQASSSTMKQMILQIEHPKKENNSSHRHRNKSINQFFFRFLMMADRHNWFNFHRYFLFLSRIGLMICNLQQWYYFFRWSKKETTSINIVLSRSILKSKWKWSEKINTDIIICLICIIVVVKIYLKHAPNWDLLWVTLSTFNSLKGNYSYDLYIWKHNVSKYI